MRINWFTQQNKMQKRTIAILMERWQNNLRTIISKHSMSQENSVLLEWQLDPTLWVDPPSIDDFRWNVLVILLFSFGCPGCLHRAIPFANNLDYKYWEKGLKIIGIHTNFEGVDYSDEQFNSQIQELYIRFPIFRDHNFNNSYHIYAAGWTPHWIIVDRSWMIRYSRFWSDPDRGLYRIDLQVQELINS